jgi:hypothetical protein
MSIEKYDDMSICKRNSKLPLPCSNPGFSANKTLGKSTFLGLFLPKNGNVPFTVPFRENDQIVQIITLE